MRKKTLAWFMLVGLIFLAHAPAYAENGSTPELSADRTAVDAYLDEVARATAAPGVFVDPIVLEEGKLTDAQVSQLDEIAAGKPGPLHLMVLPVAKLQVDRGGYTAASLGYRPRALVQEIYNRVDRKGIYAVIVSAPSHKEGQSFYAFQWARGGKVYDVGDAVDRSIECCAPNYNAMLRRFVNEADDPLRTKPDREPNVEPGLDGFDPDFNPEIASPSSGGSWVPMLLLGAFGAMGALAVVGVRGARRRTDTATDPALLETLRASLAEEIDEVGHRIAALGPGLGDHAHEIEARTSNARQLADQARTELAGLSSGEAAQGIVGVLSNARYELAAVQALLDGRPVPERTTPCFVDPRHGPSVAEVAYPASGLAEPVPVCAACQATLLANQVPTPRMLMHHGTWMNHWAAFGPSWYYLHGYWPHHSHLHRHTSPPPTLGNFGGYGPGDAPDSGGGRGFSGGGGSHGGGGHGGGGGGRGHGGGGGGGHGGGGGF